MFNTDREIDRVKEEILKILTFKSCRPGSQAGNCTHRVKNCFECIYPRGKKYRENYYFKLWHQYLYFILKDTHIIPESPTEKELFLYMIEFPILANQLYEVMK